MSRILLLIGIGGLIGSIGRYLTTLTLNRFFHSSFPYGTLTTNVLGCLAVGITFGLSERYAWLTPEWRLFLLTGVWGGYTTFSAFALENVKFLQDGQYLMFAVYSLLSFSLGLVALFLGLSLVKLIN
jgi:fluoride exporter